MLVTQAASLHKLESESYAAGRKLEEAVMRGGNSISVYYSSTVCQERLVGPAKFLAGIGSTYQMC